MAALAFDKTRWQLLSDEALLRKINGADLLEAERALDALMERTLVHEFVMGRTHRPVDTVTIAVTEQLRLLFHRRANPRRMIFDQAAKRLIVKPYPGPTGTGWVEIAILCDNQNEIDRCWTTITHWRKLLARWQGVADGGWMRDPIAHALIELKEKSGGDFGKTINADVTRHLNQLVVQHLRRYLRDCEAEERGRSNMTPEEYDQWVFEMLKWDILGVPDCYQLAMGRIEAERLLCQLGVPEPEAVAYCDRVLDCLKRKADIQKVLKESPLDYDLVRTRLRTFRKKNKTILKSLQMT